MATLSDIENMLEYWRGIEANAIIPKRKRHATKRIRELQEERERLAKWIGPNPPTKEK